MAALSVDRALWARIGEAALALVAADRVVAAQDVLAGDLERQEEELEAAVARGEELAELLSEADVPYSHRRAVRLADGRVLVVCRTTTRDEDGHPDDLEGWAEACDGELIDLQAQPAFSDTEEAE